jgi:phosphoenolpyruvate carboxykinase (GTP)
VNWFRKGDDGRFLWPGFGENARVLAWIVERSEGSGRGVESPIGVVPAPGAIDVSGLDVDEATMAALLAVDTAAWKRELEQIRAHYARFGDRLPAALREELEALARRLDG